MKSVMLSIQPKWVEKIVKGEKTIEVRKTRPKIKTPFKCYIYCTKPSNKYQTICGCMVINTDELYRLPNGKIKYGWSGELMCCKGEYTRDNFLNGKVIGEFICDKVDEYTSNERGWYCYDLETCLPCDEIAGYGKGKTLYGWHISNLKIYDKPKELFDFANYVKYQVCKERNCFSDNCWICPNNAIVIRPPQSWGYVEEL